MYLAAYFFMWRYSRKNLMQEPDRVRNTLMVRGLPPFAEKSGLGLKVSIFSLIYRPLELNIHPY